MSTTNGLVCFTNCLLPQEDGTLLQKDLWIDEKRGVILDSQKTFFLRKERPDTVIDLEGNILSPGLIDIQINGAYGFDFSVYDGDDEKYKLGLKHVAEKIVETGVTSLIPTLITQEKSLYPKILKLLRPFASPSSANILGWHSEGPFIQLEKRGAHAPPFLQTAPDGIKSFESLYGAENLTETEDWLMSETAGEDVVGVRIITAAPEVDGVMHAITELDKRGVIFSIGHSTATSEVATLAVRMGARLITHLFNAMPQLHHRDPSIIGLLGASPSLYSSFSPITASSPLRPSFVVSSPGPASIKTNQPPATIANVTSAPVSEAFDDIETPPQSPLFAAAAAARHSQSLNGAMSPLALHSRKPSSSHVHLDKVNRAFERPFYDMIVDGVHSHPNSVRLAYSAYPEGCILITDAMKILDPHLHDGIHEWRDGKRFVKEGDKLYLEGTNTLAGSVVTLNKCVRNFTRFTGCTLGEAIRCATYNPAKCLGIENKKGTLRPGAHADLVVLDLHGNVLSTWVKGKKVWTK